MKMQRPQQGKMAESDKREKLPRNTGMDKGKSPLAQVSRKEGKTASSDHKEMMEAKPKAEKTDKANVGVKQAEHHGAHASIALDKSEATVNDARQHAINAQNRLSERLQKERGCAELHDAVGHLKIPSDCPM